MLHLILSDLMTLNGWWVRMAYYFTACWTSFFDSNTIFFLNFSFPPKNGCSDNASWDVASLSSDVLILVCILYSEPRGSHLQAMNYEYFIAKLFMYLLIYHPFVAPCQSNLVSFLREMVRWIQRESTRASDMGTTMYTSMAI